MQSPISENSNNDHQRRLRRSLNFLYKRLTDDEEHSEINDLQEKRTGDNVVTFEKIKSKIWQLRYKTTKEFLDDIISIQTMMKDSSTRVQRISKGMVDYCKMEIIFIDACDSCYELANSNETKWFSAVCEKSHPLVWAKVLGFPYVPAKLLNIRDKVATVHFFGDYTISETQTKFCLRFSEKNPHPNYTTTSIIMQEVQEYIKNIGPSFEYAPRNERLSTLTPPTASTLNSAHEKLTQKTTVTIEPLKILPSTAEMDDNKSNVTMMTSPSTWTSTFGRSINDLLSQNEEQFESLKTNFKLKEAAYRSEIKELEEKLSAQKRQFDEELLEAKRKKYCDFCKLATETTVNIFCGNVCGAKWYTEQAIISQSEK